MTGVCDEECDAGWKGFLCEKGLSISILNWIFLGGWGWAGVWSRWRFLFNLRFKIV